MNDKRINLLAHAPVTEAIFKLSIPMVMGMMVQVIYNLVDTYFIGQLGDPNQLAAANLALPVFMMLMALAGIVGTGASSYISRCLGQQDYNEANRTTSISVGLLVIISIIVTFLGVLFAPQVVTMLGADAQTFDSTYNYVIIMLLGSFTVIGNFALGQLLRAEGNVMKSMLGLLIGTVLNIILDPIFIFGLDLGITGAALATIIGNFAGLLYYIFAFSTGKTLLKINLKQFNFDKLIYGEIFKIGVPSSLNQILMGFATIISNTIAINYGTLTVAGMGVAMKIIMIGTFVFMGFSAGTQPLIGYSYGSNNISRVKEVIIKGIIITSSIGLFLSVIFAVFAPNLIGAFVNDTEVVSVGTTILRALVFSLPFVGGQMIATVSAQSIGKALPALILSISRQGILYIPLLVVLNNFFGFNGFIYAQPITDVIMVVFATSLLFYILSKDETINATTQTLEATN